MRRLRTVLLLVALTPLLMGGNPPPPPPSTAKYSGPAINAVIVIIPNSASFLPAASIWLQRGGKTSGAVFISARAFNDGCLQSTEPGKTITRFVNTAQHDNRLREWIPSGSDPLSQGDILTTLFTALGITINSATNEPVITDVSNVVCMPMPAGSSLASTPPSPLNGFLGNGFLSFQAVIQFESGG